MPGDPHDILTGVAAGSWLISTACYAAGKKDEIGAYLRHVMGRRGPAPAADPDDDLLTKLEAAEQRRAAE